MWVTWADLVERTRSAPASLSPWSVAQIRRLAPMTVSRQWFERHDAVDELLDDVPGLRQAPVKGGGDVLAATRQRVEDRLVTFIEERRHDVPEARDAIAILHGAISDLTFAGGKRLRPTFVTSGFLAAGGGDDAAALDAAAAVELLHSFALLHDDVMDRSATRRGRPTAQLALREHHRAADGDAAWFGVSAAVLAGDLAFVWADQLFDRLDRGVVEPDHVGRARELFARLRTEVIAGQYLDLQTGIEPGGRRGRCHTYRPAQVGALHGDAVTADRRRSRRRRRGAARAARRLRRRRRTGVPAARRRPRPVR